MKNKESLKSANNFKRNNHMYHSVYIKKKKKIQKCKRWKNMENL